MRVRTFYRFLRTISVVVLFFFVWTFGEAWQVAAWAVASQKTGDRTQTKDDSRRLSHPAFTSASASAGRQSAQGQRPEEKFQSALKRIREGINKDDAETIKAGRAEIEKYDAELRKQFQITEERIKNLPDIIKLRQKDFEAKYQANIKTLKTDLEKIEKAGTKSERQQAYRKAIAFLKKTSPKKHHIPLDPKNLPFGNRKAAKTRAPLLSQKDYQKMFPRQKHKGIKTAFLPQSAQRSQRTAWNHQDFLSADPRLNLSRTSLRRSTQILDSEFNSAWSLPPNASIGRTPHSAPAHKPILVASNGPLTGLLSSDSKPEIHDWPFPANSASPAVNDFAFSDLTQNSELNTQNYQLALANDLPTADDLAETVEVQFTDAIKAKAAELGYNPVKIYEWVRNNIEYVPTYGSIQGADMCLQTQQCNDMDTASLLIALLRTSNIPARYIYGTMEVPIDKIMNWVGGFTDAQAALTFVASGGVPVAAGMSGGVITKARLEHVWVEANVAYGPYSGRPSNLNPDKIWVPLDPSYKQYTYTNGLDLQSAVPFDAQAFANQVLSTATTNTTDGSVTNVDSNYIQTTMTNYQTQVQNYISQNMPNATVGDIIGKKEIKKQEFGILPATLPYKIITVGEEYSEIPESLRHKISLTLFDEAGSNVMISITKSLPEIAGKKLTLSYSPASSADETTLISYATPTSSSIPVYLVNLTPELRIDGQLFAAGGSVSMGRTLPLKITLHSPATGDTLISKNNITGTYTAVALDLGVITSIQLDKISSQVAATKTKLDANDLTGIAKDDIMGEFLYGIGASYWGTLDTINKISAHTNSVGDLRLPSEGTFTYDLTPTYLFGVPISAIPSGFMTDINSDNHVVVAHDGDTSKEVNYMTQIGMFGSRMEASVYDLAFNKTYTGKGITTAHIFEYANQQGIPLYTIDSNNMNTALPLLNVSDEVKTDIQDAVNAGKIVTVPKTSVTKDSWSGVGYLIFDRATGSGVYRISGGLSGGGYTCNCFRLNPQLEFLADAILAVAALKYPGASLGLGLIVGALSYTSTLCDIQNLKLNPDDEEMFIAALTVLYIIGIVAAVLSVAIFSVTLAGAAMAWMVYSILISQLVLAIAKLYATPTAPN